MREQRVNFSHIYAELRHRNVCNLIAATHECVERSPVACGIMFSL